MPKFTDGYADKLQVPAGATDVQAFDTKLPGFGIRKYASGAAVYFVKFNVGKQQRRKTLGAVVKGNLDDMRKLASGILANAHLGTDVVAVAKAAAAKSSMPTLGALIPTYLEVREKGLDGTDKLRDRSLSEVSRYLAGSTTKDKDGKVKERTPSV